MGHDLNFHIAYSAIAFSSSSRTTKVKPINADSNQQATGAPIGADPTALELLPNRDRSRLSASDGRRQPMRTHACAALASKPNGVHS